MIQAELKGKVPEVQNMEDVLTSNVFGLLKYISRSDVFVRILSYARSLSGKSLLDCIDFDLNSYSKEFHFWEQVGVYGEPDLIIKFRKDGEADLILCVEVKYYSPKSGEGDDDQLMRYFEGLMEFASLSQSNFLGVIYLTKYPSRKEIADSLNCIGKKGITDADEKVFHLKWSEITEAIRGQNKDSFTLGEKEILDDLLRYLKHKNLVSFSKFTFQSVPFDLRLDRFYKSRKFMGFTFLEIDFDIAKIDKVFYGVTQNE